MEELNKPEKTTAKINKDWEFIKHAYQIYDKGYLNLPIEKNREGFFEMVDELKNISESFVNNYLTFFNKQQLGEYINLNSGFIRDIVDKLKLSEKSWMHRIKK